MEQKKETVYLIGNLTDDWISREKFYTAANKLQEAGFYVLNPALISSGFSAPDALERIMLAMLAEFDTVCFLPGWEESKEATYQYGRAVALKKRIFLYEEWEKEQDRIKEKKNRFVNIKCHFCGPLTYLESAVTGNLCPKCGSEIPAYRISEWKDDAED